MARNSDDIYDEWWAKAGLGAILIGVAFWMRADLIKLDSGQVHSMRVNWFVALAYKFGGVSGAFYLLLAIAAILLVLGLRQLAAEK